MNRGASRDVWRSDEEVKPTDLASHSFFHGGEKKEKKKKQDAAGRPAEPCERLLSQGGKIAFRDGTEDSGQLLPPLYGCGFVFPFHQRRR